MSGLVARVLYRDRELAVLEPVPRELRGAVDHCADIHGLVKSGEVLVFREVPKGDLVSGELLRRAEELIRCVAKEVDSGESPAVYMGYAVHPLLEPFVVIGEVALLKPVRLLRLYLAVSPVSSGEAVDTMYRELGGGRG